jgi:glutamyl-tRNA synthetase
MLTRFAPSPTGFLHIGNLRTALLCYLYARKEGGTYMLRIDDTDVERSKQEYVDAIIEDLTWLGLQPDRIEKQSARFPRYNEVVEQLKAKGRIYPCYESQEELEVKRKVQLSRGLPPVYDRAALKLTDAEKAKFEAEGRKPHYRFKLEAGNIEWDDEIRGIIKFQAENMSDPIIIRGNGLYTYMLPSTVDDVDFKVTHVLRGEDHISNTAIQLQIFDAMGAPKPKFAHVSFVKTKDGKLSKREGSSGVKELREESIRPMSILSFLAKVGTSDSIELRDNLQQLVAEFDIKKFSKSATFYTFEDIQRLNTELLHEANFADVKHRLPADLTEDFWNIVRKNVESFDDAANWWNICTKNITPDIAAEDKDFVKSAIDALPPEPWDQTTWGTITEALKTSSGRKGKQLFMPLRKALTGLEHGPELKEILPFIGRARAVERLGS